MENSGGVKRRRSDDVAGQQTQKRTIVSGREMQVAEALSTFRTSFLHSSAAAESAPANTGSRRMRSLVSAAKRMKTASSAIPAAGVTVKRGRTGNTENPRATKRGKQATPGTPLRERNLYEFFGLPSTACPAAGASPTAPAAAAAPGATRRGRRTGSRVSSLLAVAGAAAAPAAAPVGAVAAPAGATTTEVGREHGQGAAAAGVFPSVAVMSTGGAAVGVGPAAPAPTEAAAAVAGGEGEKENRGREHGDNGNDIGNGGGKARLSLESNISLDPSTAGSTDGEFPDLSPDRMPRTSSSTGGGGKRRRRQRDEPQDEQAMKVKG
ncbi:unnamed protein product [Pylaiella littoralis]